MRIRGSLTVPPPPPSLRKAGQAETDDRIILAPQATSNQIPPASAQAEEFDVMPIDVVGMVPTGVGAKAGTLINLEGKGMEFYDGDGNESVGWSNYDWNLDSQSQYAGTEIYGVWDQDVCADFEVESKLVWHARKLKERFVQCMQYMHCGGGRRKFQSAIFEEM